MAHPEFILDLKRTVNADLPARARLILDTTRRRAMIASLHERLGGSPDLDAWVEGRPLVAVEFLVE